MKVKFLDAEILAGEGLPELPIRRRHAPGGRGAPVTAGDPEGERLAHQHRVGLPVLPPVSAHAHPVRFAALHAHPHDIPCTRHVGDQNQVEVLESVDREPYSPDLPACHPAVGNGDYSGTVLSDLEEHGHGEVKVGAWGVAPAPIVAGKSEVWGTEVGGGDHDGRASRVAPFGILVTLDQEARAAAQPIVE